MDQPLTLNRNSQETSELSEKVQEFIFFRSELGLALVQ